VPPGLKKIQKEVEAVADEVARLKTLRHPSIVGYAGFEHRAQCVAAVCSCWRSSFPALRRRRDMRFWLCGRNISVYALQNIRCRVASDMNLAAVASMLAGMPKLRCEAIRCGVTSKYGSLASVELHVDRGQAEGWCLRVRLAGLDGGSFLRADCCQEQERRPYCVLLTNLPTS
jgi:hypothetical protein